MNKYTLAVSKKQYNREQQLYLTIIAEMTQCDKYNDECVFRTVWGASDTVVFHKHSCYMTDQEYFFMKMTYPGKLTESAHDIRL